MCECNAKLFQLLVLIFRSNLCLQIVNKSAWIVLHCHWNSYNDVLRSWFPEDAVAIRFVKHACHMVHGSRVDLLLGWWTFAITANSGLAALLPVVRLGWVGKCSQAISLQFQLRLVFQICLSFSIYIYITVFAKAHSIQPRNQTVISEYHITYFQNKLCDILISCFDFHPHPTKKSNRYIRISHNLFSK